MPTTLNEVGYLLGGQRQRDNLKTSQSSWLPFGGKIKIPHAIADESRVDV